MMLSHPETSAQSPLHLLRSVAFVLALLVGLPVASDAQPAHGTGGTIGSWFLRSYTTDDGLPETRVSAITQTRDGYLWLGTRRGLVRFDGLNFTLYSPDNTPALPSFRVVSLSTDSRGRLWVGTANGLVVKEGHTFTRVDTTQVPATGVWEVLEDRRGRLWVATERGARVGDGRRFQPVPGSPTFVYGIEEDTVGRIWLAGRRSLAWTMGDSARDATALLPQGRRYYDVLRDGASLWFGTRRGLEELRIAPDGTPKAGRFIPTSEGIQEHAVWALGRSPDGALWAGTSDIGALLWDGEHLHRLGDPRNDVQFQVWGFHTDSRGRVWVGTGAGLQRYQQSAFETYRHGQGLATTWAVRGTPGGTVWASADDGSISRWTGRDFSVALGKATRAVSSPLWPWGNRVLVAHGGETLWEIPERGAPRRTTFPGLPAGEIFAFLDDADGSVLVATESGVYRYDGAQARPASAELGIPQGTIPHEMLRDGRGRLLLGRPGLTIVDGPTVRRYGRAEGLVDEDVLALYAQGPNIWIGTADSGLYVLRDDRITPLGHLDARLRREILGITEDDLGFLWLTSSFGLSRVALADLEGAVSDPRQRVAIRSFDRDDGLPTSEFNAEFQSRLHRHPDGTLWLPSYNGIVRVDPRRIAADTLPPQVHIERFVVDGNSLPLADGHRLSSGINRVELSVSATDALVPGRVRMQFRVEGLDTGWVDLGPRRTLSIGPLRGGSYRFVVRAANEEGNWSATPATLAFSVRYALYEHGWFIPALVALSAGGVALVARLRQRRLERRGRELARVVEERTQDLEAARATLERRVDERTAELAAELAERKRLEQELVQAQKLEGLGRLAGGVAHEINNSMTGVLGFTELAALAARGQPRVLKDLGEVRRAGERVAGITRQLLTFARLQQGERSEVDLGLVVEQLDRSLQQAAGDRVRLEIAASPGLPRLLADRRQLEQVVLNLVMNARDATPETGGTVTVQVSARTLAEEQTIGNRLLGAGPYVVLSVSDTGSGMTDEVRSRIFEPFFTTKDVTRGSGMGLAVCHGIVVELGGAIAVDSTLGEGTTMAVWLPATLPPAATAHVSAEHAAVPGHETVLLVEDEAAVREVARRTLQMSGYEVLVARDGQEALALAEAELPRIDLVLTDVVMPKLGGLDLARSLRRQREDLPLVFMSGFTGHEPDLEEALSTLGPMMSKPFTTQTLVSTVRRELDRKRHTPPNGTATS